MDRNDIDRVVAMTGHERFRVLLDPASNEYDPLSEHTVSAFLGLTRPVVVPLRENLSRLDLIKRCRWLDKQCGCQWGTCKNQAHERFGKEVGYHDCLECKLMEVSDGSQLPAGG